MNIIKLFCFPVAPGDKTNPKSPDYRISAQVVGGFNEVGAGWKAETKDGKKYISITLKETFNGQPGYKLAEDYEPHPQRPTMTRRTVEENEL